MIDDYLAGRTHLCIGMWWRYASTVSPALGKGMAAGPVDSAHTLGCPAKASQVLTLSSCVQWFDVLACTAYHLVASRTDYK